MQVYRDSDADLGLIRNRRIAIIGYGNQGRAQALNLRDSGVAELVIGLAPGSPSRERAEAGGFAALAPAEAAAQAGLVAILAPDETHGPLYAEHIAPNLRPGTALL